MRRVLMVVAGMLLQSCGPVDGQAVDGQAGSGGSCTPFTPERVLKALRKV